MTSRPGVERSNSARVLAVAVIAGLLSGALGAYSYHSPTLRPLSHTLGLWLIVVLTVAASRPGRTAILGAATSLMVAVVVFYVGKKVMYAIRCPGMPYLLDVSEITLWLVLAVVAGVGLGWAFHAVGRPGWPGAVAAAAAAGLLVGDALRRAVVYTGDLAVCATIGLAGLIVLVVLIRARGVPQWGRTALLTVPATAVGVLLVSAPDVVEQLVFIGW